jgi:hypothetical protein
LAQITKDRVMDFNSWDGLEEYEETMRDKITLMLRAAQPRFAPPTTKAGLYTLHAVASAWSSAVEWS